jgi:two-component system CheB/CheR fusion protein
MANPEEDQEFEKMLDHIQNSRNIDFHGYKRMSLKRRTLKRMQTVGVKEFNDYSAYLDEHPDEFAQLFNTILINVTSFFRDPPAWDYLGKEIIPRILADKAPGDPIRIWSAGCASGEETYSLAMLMAEALGQEAFTRRAKIYGTDVDEDALFNARRASFTEKAVQAIPAELLNKYFVRAGDRYAFRADLRRSVIFGNHDLTKDAPISRLDLLVCRNTLMYFNTDAQRNILTFFHFALGESGFLFLGKAETLLSHANLFTSVAMKHRIFYKKSKFNMHERLFFPAETNAGIVEHGPASQVRLREVALEASPVAHAMVDSNGILALANQRTRALFNLSLKDIGRPLQDLELSYRPVELRSVIEKVLSQGQPERLTKVGHTPPGGEPVSLDIQIVPIKGFGAEVLGVDITFEDMTLRWQLEDDLLHSNQELETLNEVLQSAHEELETTNEELQSTNEELETTNEELQSANEELETINEELQSTNEELITLNEDHQRRTEELNVANSFLHCILASLHSGVIVLDEHINLLLWNRRSEDLWGLRDDEVRGKSLLSLDIGLPVERLPLKAFISGKFELQEFTLKAINRRGKSFLCHVECTPFTNSHGVQDGIVLIMDEVEGPPKKK